jgi:hypothetical protein
MSGGLKFVLIALAVLGTVSGFALQTPADGLIE